MFHKAHVPYPSTESPRSKCPEGQSHRFRNEQNRQFGLNLVYLATSRRKIFLPVLFKIMLEMWLTAIMPQHNFQFCRLHSFWSVRHKWPLKSTHLRPKSATNPSVSQVGSSYGQTITTHKMDYKRTKPNTPHEQLVSCTPSPIYPSLTEEQ